MLVLLALSAPCAAMDRVLWYQSFDDPDDPYRETVEALTEAATAAGASDVNDEEGWPSDILEYKLVFLVAPEIAFTDEQVADLEALLDAGGVLVVLGDWSGYTDATLAANPLLADLGSSLSIDTTVAYDSDCSHTATAVGTHHFVEGVVSIEYAYTGAVDAGDGEVLATGESGQDLMAAEDGIVVTADVNIFSDGCWTSYTEDNAQLVANLYDGGCSDEPDGDGDGYDALACGGLDCDDGDASTILGPVWYDDADGDGYGDDSDTSRDCEAPERHVAVGGDCNDTDAEVVEGYTWWIDADGDDYGTADATLFQCRPPEGYARNDGDCDDNDSTRHPDAPETCDDDDDDCDGSIDEDAVDIGTWYPDEDGDGYGDEDAVVVACDAPDGFIETGGDCYDGLDRVHPGADEYCDGNDEDCDGVVDEDALDVSTWYVDADGDGYGVYSRTTTACDVPDGFVADAGDCDDGDPDAYPNAPGLDEACVALPEEDRTPADKGASGCGCSPPGGGAGAWAALVGLLAAGVRRGRSRLAER